ncbi:MAG: HypC/HybG/HupF family hydrogenase formation chaperone [Butyrivibrio sp.]|jgi:hydrogenase expression/formation protein HypC|nr:HypC/HybG/HupF family hydrogenase formation chaperone [Butyrivibrio sp.]
MCVAIPGTVIEIEGTKARVDFNGNIVNAEAGLVDVKVGDKVLVHAGLIIQTMDSDLAKEMDELYREIEGLTI